MPCGQALRQGSGRACLIIGTIGQFGESFSVLGKFAGAKYNEWGDTANHGEHGVHGDKNSVSS